MTTTVTLLFSEVHAEGGEHNVCSHKDHVDNGRHTTCYQPDYVKPRIYSSQTSRQDFQFRLTLLSRGRQ